MTNMKKTMIVVGKTLVGFTTLISGMITLFFVYGFFSHGTMIEYVFENILYIAGSVIIFSISVFFSWKWKKEIFEEGIMLFLPF